MENKSRKQQRSRLERDSVQQSPGSLEINLGWAFSPWTLLLSLPIPLFLISIIQPASSYLLWGQPYWITQEYVVLAAATIFILGFIFSINARVNRSSTKILFSNDLVRKLRRAKNAIALLVSISYFIWIVSGLTKGLNVSILLDALNGSNGAIWKLKTDILAPISGVTTWVALATILGPLAIILWRITGESQKVLLITLLGVTALRATFFSERLAIVELGIACIFAYASTARQVPLPLRTVKNYVLTLSIAFTLYVGFFSATELIRSWVYYSNKTQISIVQFSFERIIAYYATALNNGALYININKYSWSPFDLIQGTFDTTLASNSIAFLGASGLEKFSAALFYRSNPEFNNVSGLLITNSSLGIVGSWIFWIVIGSLACLVFNKASSGSLIAFLAYPIFAIGIIEIVRLFYFGQTRIIPNLIALFVLSTYLGRMSVELNPANPSQKDIREKK